MARARHPEDITVYQQLLEATRNDDDVENRDEAVKLLAEKLAGDAARISDYAWSRAQEVAAGFDNTHKPQTENGQMAFDVDSYLVIGESERIRVDKAKARHSRQWLAVLASNKAKVDAAYGAKYLHGEKLLAIQDERNCSMWEAEQILRGEKP